MTLDTLLQNKVAIITGASRGIGRATALAFAKAGGSVVLAARSEEIIKTLANDIKAQGGQALAIPTDVTNQADVDLLTTLTLRAFRQVDILINNAGLLQPIGKTWEVNPEAWQNLIRLNVVGPYLCMRAVLPTMLAQGEGRIINVSSGAADSNVEGWGAYCASKAALDRLSGVLAAEVADTGIVVASMNPGATDTQMQADIRQTTSSQFKRGDYFRRLHDQGKLFQPDEAAQLLLWLASDYAKNENGNKLDLNNAAVRERIAQDLDLSPIDHSS